MVRKLEKSVRIGIWLNPKYQCNGCLAGKVLSAKKHMEDPQRLASCGRCKATSVWWKKNFALSEK